MDTIDEVLNGFQIPVFLTISKRLVYLTKRPGRQVAKLPRKLKKHISKNLTSVGKTFRGLCVSTFAAEYSFQREDIKADLGKIAITCLTVKNDVSENQSVPFFFRDLDVPKADM